MRIISRGPVEKTGPRGAKKSASRRDFPSPYFTLACGHLTTASEQIAYAVFRPKGGYKNFCEICGKWVVEKPKPKPPELPWEPMF